MAVFKNLVIAVAGTLEHEAIQIKKWIDANGGRYSTTVLRGGREEATAKKKAEEEAAKQAQIAKSDRAGSAVPSFASTVDSLPFPVSRSSRALSTTSFAPSSLALGAQAKKTSLKDLYHYYFDSTGFEYKVILTRCSLWVNEITRYRLSLLETHTKSHACCTFIEYFPPTAGNTTVSGDLCIQALLDFDKTFQEGTAPETDPFESVNDSQENSTDARPAALLLPQQDIQHHPEAERLRDLLAPRTTMSIPRPADRSYKSLIAPQASDFATAWRAFRHTHFAIEPFVYVRPKHGLPIGLRVQQAGLFQNQTLTSLGENSSIFAHLSTQIQRENDDGYVYNSFALPALARAGRQSRARRSRRGKATC